MIEIQNLTKVFQEQTVLQNINATFDAGLIHGVIGKNGAGKTVLLRLLCGLMHPSKGQVIVDGKQLGKDVDFAPDAGIIIETPCFLPYLSGFQNLKELASIRNIISKEEIAEAMEQVKLDPSSRKHVGKYSLGMRQRLGIAHGASQIPHSGRANEWAGYAGNGGRTRAFTEAERDRGYGNSCLSQYGRYSASVRYGASDTRRIFDTLYYRIFVNILSFSAHKNLILLGHHRPNSGWISGAVKCRLFRRQLASFSACKLFFSVSSKPFLLTKHLRERDLTIRPQHLLIAHTAHFLVCCRVNIRI